MCEAFKVIILKESPRGLYKGLLPTVVQIAPNTGFQFAFYHLSASVWNFLEEKLNRNSASREPTGIILWE